MMNYSPIAHLKTWNSSRRVARLLQSIQKKYVGQSVVELMPNGEKWAGHIEQMEWDSSIGLEGTWAVYVRYDDQPFGSWTDCSVLELTGSKE